MLRERVELLAIGEAIGYPRLGIGHRDGKKLAIRAGQSEWEKFCGHAHTTRIPAALRIGRILRDNHVTPYNPRTEPRVTAINGNVLTVTRGEPDTSEAVPVVVIGLDDPIDEMVKPRRSSAAVRQARWRERQKAAKN
jgi:hypothetical protein